MASSLNKVRSGSFKGNGTTKKIVLGFQPKHVVIFNASAGGLVRCEKMAGMATSYAVKEAAAGTKTFPANMCTINSDGFTVGNDSDLNVALEDLHYTAWEGKNE